MLWICYTLTFVHHATQSPTHRCNAHSLGAHHKLAHGMIEHLCTDVEDYGGTPCTGQQRKPRLSLQRHWSCLRLTWVDFMSSCIKLDALWHLLIMRHDLLCAHRPPKHRHVLQWQLKQLGVHGYHGGPRLIYPNVRSILVTFSKTSKVVLLLRLWHHSALCNIVSSKIIL